MSRWIRQPLVRQIDLDLGPNLATGATRPRGLTASITVLWVAPRSVYRVACLIVSRYIARQRSLWSNWVEVIVSLPGCGPLCYKSLLSSPTDNKEVVTD